MQQKKGLEKKYAYSVRESLHKQAYNSVTVEGSKKDDEKRADLSWSLINGDKKEQLQFLSTWCHAFKCTDNYDSCFR